MSTTPLTDSINALTTYANEVTGASDTTLSDAVYTLAQGYGQAVQIISYALSCYQMFYTNNSNRYNLPSMPEDVELDLPYCTTIQGMFGQYLTYNYYNLGIKTLTLKLYQECNCKEAFRRNSSINTINLPNGLLVTNDSGIFEDSAVKTINGVIDYADNATRNSSAYGYASNIEEIRFAENCLTISYKFKSAVLTDDSLVSIANGLDGTVTGQTLTLHATPLARCSEIVGTVTDGTFTADDSGSVTLADFITNTKGWTLA